ncbi:MAG: transcription termination/antitermination protein NusG [SAR324 cluster bacterium]|nr:transcription termination/antitermination protein NusG [SAR324 cluster bacterium]
MPDKMVEEQTGTEMLFEEQEKNTETQEINSDDQEDNLSEETDVDLEVQENAPQISDAYLGEQEDAATTEMVETVENSMETENQTEETESQVAEKPQNPNVKWYILQAYSGYEGRVEQTIREKLRIKGIEHLVDEIFIPSEDITRTKEGKKRKVNQKYFPGYVLIHMELTPELWHLLMDVNRVSGFIGGTQKKPLPLDEKELEEIRSQVNEGFQQKATEDEYSVGQKVTITEGSFGNFSGTIDEVNLERRKLKVLVSIFGRPTPVEVEFENVKHVVE